MAKDDSGLIRLTGLWRQQSGAGYTFLAGSVSPSSRLLILPNKGKQQDKDPDYIAYLAPPKRDQDKAKPETAQRQFWQSDI